MLRAERLLYPRTSLIDRSVVSTTRETQLFVISALAHLPLGILLYNVGPAVAMLHPIAALAAGFYYASKKRFGLDRIALVGGYIIGSEVLWRMAQIPVFWEVGKFGTAAIMIAALVTRRRFEIPKLALVYFLALIPACVLTLIEFDLVDSRGIMSFNMSGPLLLLVSCWFFSHVQVTAAGVRKLLFATIVPLLSVAGVTLFYSVTVENIHFGGESNLATSGGFGPNQVSSMLGLGFFLAVSCLVLFRNSSTKLKIFLGVVASFLAAQSLLTFSRGGMYNAIGGLLILVLFHFRDITDGLKRLVPLASLAVLFLLIVFPILDNFTGGKLQERFEDTGTTNRAELMETDLEVFLQNPILGVGVGAARNYRKQVAEISGVSHTEFSRLLSEHGTFGIVAVASLFLIIVTNVKRQRATLAKALTAGSSLWCMLFMFNAGMRLAAPAFVLGLGFISIRAVRPFRPRPNSKTTEKPDKTIRDTR